MSDQLRREFEAGINPEYQRRDISERYVSLRVQDRWLGFVAAAAPRDQLIAQQSAELERLRAELAGMSANQWQRVTDTEPGDGENVVVADADGIFAPTGYRVGGEWFHVGIEGAPKFFFRVPPCPDELKGEGKHV